jgi:membrane AbrB-like protein
LLIGAAGAGLFWLLGFPAAVLTGPAATVSIAALLGVGCRIPAFLRDAVLLVLGVSIGSTVTPDVIATAMTWPASFLVLTATLFVILVSVRAVLMRGFSYDRVTAALAATPGHLSYVLALSTDLKADVPRVALVQSVRVLLLTLVVPVLIAAWGVEGTTPPMGHGTIALWAAAFLFACALPVGLLFKRLGVPAALLLGAMAVSAAGHVSDLTPGALPWWATAIAFIVMGSMIGTRFRGIDRRGVAGAFLAGSTATLIACIAASLGALLAAWLTGLPLAALFLAFAPGGVEVMAALAVETALEPAFVAAHHVFRLVFLSVLIPVILARMR